MFNRFDTVPECHGQTDGRTKLLYQYRVMNEYGRAMKTINTGESRNVGLLAYYLFLQMSFRDRKPV